MEHVRYETEGAVARVVLDRPPVNALNDAIVAEIGEAVRRLEEGDVRAAIITGHPHFAAGADIAEFREAHAAAAGGSLARGLAAVVRRLEQVPLPVIAAVHGYALGGGLELAMGADLIYLAEDARVGQPEIKLGIIPGAGGTQRLPRLVGPARAREIIYTGRFVEADEALRIGLASKVVAAAELDAVAMEDAAALAAGPTAAIAAAKRVITEGLGRPIDDGLAEEGRAFAGTFTTEDAREGVAAFVDKREPDFGGR